MDRRGIFVTLTEAGRQRHAEALPTHREVLGGVLPTGLMASCRPQPDGSPGTG